MPTPYIENQAQTKQVEFANKPLWLDYWSFKQNFLGSEVALVGGGVVVQRFTAAASNVGKAMTLRCPWVTFSQLQTLYDLVNETEELTVQPEEATTTYKVVFRANNPIEVSQVAGIYPDEDKNTAGSPYNRYTVTLHLVVVQ